MTNHDVGLSFDIKLILSCLTVLFKYDGNNHHCLEKVSLQSKNSVMLRNSLSDKNVRIIKKKDLKHRQKH